MAQGSAALAGAFAIATSTIHTPSTVDPSDYEPFSAERRFSMDGASIIVGQKRVAQWCSVPKARLPSLDQNLRLTDLQKFEGKTVTVRGMIKDYQGTPEIAITSLSQVWE